MIHMANPGIWDKGFDDDIVVIRGSYGKIRVQDSNSLGFRPRVFSISFKMKNKT